MHLILQLILKKSVVTIILNEGLNGVVAFTAIG